VTFAFGVSIPAPGVDISDLEVADFVVLDERAGLDSLSALAFLAPRTTVGLVAEVDISYVEPFFASKAVATLDHIAAGRAGWQVKVDPSREAASRHGVRALPPDELADRAIECADVMRALWDSWDSDAIVRDAARGIFLDSGRVHHINHVGRYHKVRGPAILPRPPQGHPPTFVRCYGTTRCIRLAGALGEVIRTSAAHVEAVRERFPEARVLVDIPFTGVAKTLALISEVSPVAHGVVVELDTLAPLRALAGERVPRTGTLRSRLGLPPAVSRFAREEAL
jgi:hypothetical protein